MTRRKLKIPIVLSVAAVAIAMLPSAASGRPASPAAGLKPFYGVLPLKPLRDQDFNRMEWGGIGTLRINITWSMVEPTGDGSYRFDEVDEMVEAATRRGIRLLPTVYAAPPWLSYDRRKLPVWSRYAKAKWKSMLKALVGRYGKHGDFWSERPDLPKRPIRDWQIWNEPNIINFAFPVSARKYARLIRASATAIRSVDPSAKVVLGGLYGAPRRRAGVHAGKFLNRLYRTRGFRKSFDLAAVHPYARNTRLALALTSPVRKVLNRHGNRHRPMMITELGWGSDSATGFGTGSDYAQARQLTSAYRMLLRHRAWLKLKAVIWFGWSDLPATNKACVFCYHNGLFDVDDDAKPSWWALLNFTRGG